MIPTLLPIVDKFEVCSPGELEICRGYHVPGEMILFSGVVKTKENIQTALKYPVDVITLESMQHWELLKDCMKQLHERTGNIPFVKIMPRLSSGAQFGMEEEQLLRIVAESVSLENIEVAGVHYFTGTQKKGNKYEKELEKIFETMEVLRKEYGLEKAILEYGPGFAIPYFVGDEFEMPYGLVEQMKQYIIEKKYPFRIDIELGRYIAASCGKYFTSIVDIKKVDERNYCLVDGGIHHVNYYGSNMAMRTPIVQHISRRKSDTDKEEIERIDKSGEYMVCGALCTFADILIRGIRLHDPNIGDTLVFKNIGAYSVTEGSYLFLSRDLPGIYLQKQDGSIHELREPTASYGINSESVQVKYEKTENNL